MLTLKIIIIKNIYHPAVVFRSLLKLLSCEVLPHPAVLTKETVIQLKPNNYN